MNNKPHGKGIFFWSVMISLTLSLRYDVVPSCRPNGAKYEGDVAGGYRDGQGSLTLDFLRSTSPISVVSMLTCLPSVGLSFARRYAGSWKHGKRHGEVCLPDSLIRMTVVRGLPAGHAVLQ